MKQSNSVYPEVNSAHSTSLGIRELSAAELAQVSGGITRGEAGAALAGLGASIVTGAIVGGIAAGPIGLVAGAAGGAGKAAFTFGFAALIVGSFASSGGKLLRKKKTVTH